MPKAGPNSCVRAVLCFTTSSSMHDGDEEPTKMSQIATLEMKAA